MQGVCRIVHRSLSAASVYSVKTGTKKPWQFDAASGHAGLFPLNKPLQKQFSSVVCFFCVFLWRLRKTYYVHGIGSTSLGAFCIHGAAPAHVLTCWGGKVMLIL